MSLRRFFIASSLILAPITTLGFGSAAFADTDSDTVELSGTVDSVLSIFVDSSGTEASSLPMTQLSPQSEANVVRVANLDITSNNPGGITITTQSTNNGKLKSANNDEIPYTIAIVDGGSGAPPSTHTLSISNYSQAVNGFDPQTGLKVMNLYISYDVSGMPTQGTYTDTITITVADGVN